MDKQRIIIVDDHRLFREGLKLMLQEYDKFEIIGEANNGLEFLDFIKHTRPDLVIMDINMPQMNGIEASRKALKDFPDLNILVLSMLGEEDYYNELVEIGVKGFLLKNSDPDDLINGINRISEGAVYFSQELLMGILEGKLKREHTIKDISLTPREMDVLKLMCKGMTNSEIADSLFLSQRTVDRHKSNLFSKTGTLNSISLVIYAIRNKIVSI